MTSLRWGVTSRIVLERKSVVRIILEARDRPHRLDGVGADDLLVRLSLKIIVSTVVDEPHVPQERRLGERSEY